MCSDAGFSSADASGVYTLAAKIVARFSACDVTPRAPLPTRPLPPADIEYVLQTTEKLWPEVRGQRIFLTGGTGFFGCWLLETFLAANDAFGLDAGITVLSRSTEGFRQRSPHLANHRVVELVAGDVREFPFPAGEFRYVLHAATESVPRQDLRPQDMLATIVDGTRRCLAFAEMHGTRKFLLTSSGAVYGPQPTGMSHIPEEYPGAPNAASPAAAYGEGKRLAELLCAMTAAESGMECKIARCFAFVGPHLPLDAHFAIGNFLRDAMHGGPIRIQGDGTPRRSYLYAADLAIWLWTMLLRAPSMRPYNVGSGQDRSIREIAEAVARVLDPGMEIQVAQAAVPGTAVHRYVPRVEAAIRELEVPEGIPLEDAIRRTAAWHGWQPERG